MALSISKKLIKFADFNPTKESTQLPIKELCSEIDKGNILLPLFQTSIRWTKKKSIDLLNFQLLGKAPVSPISMNRIEDESLAVTQVSFITRTVVTNTKGKLSVNDGQQRLTCNYKSYIDHPDFRYIVLDLIKGMFDEIKDEEIKKHQIPVGKLLNKNRQEFFDYTNSNSFLKKGEVLDVLLQIRNKLFNYFYTINFAKDLDEDEQINWFEVLNLAGSKVPLIQMKFAKLLVQGIDIYTEYTAVFANKLKEHGFGDLFPKKDTEVSIPIATLNPSYEIVNNRNHISNYSTIPSDTKESQLCSLEPYKLRQCFNLTLSALDKTLEFINIHQLSHPSRIDYITYLTGFFVYIGDTKLSENQNKLLIDWYKKTSFTNQSNPVRRTMFEELLYLRNK